MKVNLPPQLIVGDKDDYLNKNLRSIFNLAGKDSQLIPKAFTEKFENFKKLFLKSIPKHGLVMLKTKKTEFSKELETLKKGLEQIKMELKAVWDTEIQEYQEKLVKSLVPNVVASPPKELLAQINEPKVSEDIARKHLQKHLKEAFPTFEDVTGKMKIECLFKGITYETLNDEVFQKAIEEQFPYIPWTNLFHEYDAVEAEPAN